MQNASWLQLAKKQQHSRKYSSKLLEWSYHSLLFHWSRLAVHYNCTDFPKCQHVPKPLTLLSIRNNRMPRNRKVALTNYVTDPCAPDRPGSFEQNDQKAQDSVSRWLIPPLILLAGAERENPQKISTLTQIFTHTTPVPSYSVPQQELPMEHTWEVILHPFCFTADQINPIFFKLFQHCPNKCLYQCELGGRQQTGVSRTCLHKKSHLFFSYLWCWKESNSNNDRTGDCPDFIWSCGKSKF